MNPAVKYLLQCKTFFLANIADDKPQVRPFGAVM